MTKIYLAELMLIFDVLTTFVGTLSLPKALKEATRGRANTRMLTMLFILLLRNKNVSTKEVDSDIAVAKSA